MNYLQVTECPRDDKKITRRWEVYNRQRNIYLGDIAWWPSWRRYTFQPAPQTLFDANCLGEIAMFIDERMEERKRERQAAIAPTEAKGD